MNRFAMTFVSLLHFAAMAPAEPPAKATGAIAGTVRFTGEVPPPKKITTVDGGSILHSDLLVDPKTKGLRYVVALLEDAKRQPKLKEAKPVTVDQRDMAFIPRVVAVQYGQAVSFDNSDLFNHSVMASSKVPANQLNVFVSPGKPLEHVFQPQARPILIGCALHAWMRAWVIVVEHPWFAVSDAQGRFRIENIPPGKYTLSLRHPDTGRQEKRTLEVSAGKTAAVTIEWAKIDPR